MVFSSLFVSSFNVWDDGLSILFDEELLSSIEFVFSELSWEAFWVSWESESLFSIDVVFVDSSESESVFPIDEDFSIEEAASNDETKSERISLYTRTQYGVLPRKQSDPAKIFNAYSNYYYIKNNYLIFMLSS